MKYLFAVKIDPQTQNRCYGAEELLSRRNADRSVQGAIKSDGFFSFKNILKILDGILFLIVLCLLVFLLQDLINNKWSFDRLLGEMNVVVIVFFGVMVAAFALLLFNVKDSWIERWKRKQKGEDRSAEEELSDQKFVIDCLAFDYDDSDGKIRIISRDKYDYNNIPVTCRIKNGMIRLSDSAIEYTVSTSEFTNVKKIEQRISIPNWNKSVSVQSEEVRPHMATCAKNNLALRSYCVFSLFHGGKRYELLVPTYDAGKLATALGIAWKA